MRKRSPLEAQNDTVVAELNEEEEEGDVEELEESVTNMAHQILDYRNTFSNHLKTTFTSLLESQRPILPQPGPSSQAPLGASRGSASEGSLTEENPEDIEKLELLKQKISSNALNITDTLKRMRECMDRMDKLQSRRGVIHPAFKMQRLTG